MTEAVTVALISGLCVAVPSVITTMFSNNKANTLMNYRIDELTKKVEKHNNVVERMALQERETKAIWKRIDEIKEELEKAGEDFRILIGPDHPTPIAIRTHSKEPIPFMIYDSTKDYEGQEEYSEEAARETGIVISHAYDLMNRLLQK